MINLGEIMADHLAMNFSLLAKSYNSSRTSLQDLLLYMDATSLIFSQMNEISAFGLSHVVGESPPRVKLLGTLLS